MPARLPALQRAFEQRVAQREVVLEAVIGTHVRPRLRNQRALATMPGVDLSTLLAEEKPQQVREPRASCSELDGKDQLAIREYATLPAAHRKLIRELIAALASEAARQKI